MSRTKKAGNVNNSSEATTKQVSVIFTQFNKVTLKDDEGNKETFEQKAEFESLSVPCAERIEDTVLLLMEGIYRSVKTAVQLKNTSVIVNGAKVNLRGKFQISVRVGNEIFTLAHTTMGAIPQLMNDVKFNFRNSTSFGVGLFKLIAIAEGKEHILSSVQENKLQRGMNTNLLLTEPKKK